MMKLQNSYQWTDNTIDISDFYDALPAVVKNLVDDLENAEARGDDGEYINLCESIEYAAKLYVPSGRITKSQFQKLRNRYYGG